MLIQDLKNKDISDRYINISFFILFLIVLLTLWQINRFMPVYNMCLDDFAMIERCKCMIW